MEPETSWEIDEEQAARRRDKIRMWIFAAAMVLALIALKAVGL